LGSIPSGVAGDFSKAKPIFIYKTLKYVRKKRREKSAEKNVFNFVLEHTPRCHTTKLNFGMEPLTLINKACQVIILNTPRCHTTKLNFGMEPLTLINKACQVITLNTCFFRITFYLSLSVPDIINYNMLEKSEIRQCVNYTWLY
jgi:hypothetical protein